MASAPRGAEKGYRALLLVQLNWLCSCDTHDRLAATSADSLFFFTHLYLYPHSHHLASSDIVSAMMWIIPQAESMMNMPIKPPRTLIRPRLRASSASLQTIWKTP